MQVAALQLSRDKALFTLTDRDEIETECDGHIESLYEMIRKNW